MSLLTVLIRAFLVWLVIIAAETVHGVLRGVLLVPIVGDLPARQIGVLIGSLLVFGVAYVFIRWIAARTTPRLLVVGLLWVVLTVLFELGLGRLVLGLPWDRIIEDYDMTRGGFMGPGLLFMSAAPLLVAWLRRPHGHDPEVAEPSRPVEMHPAGEQPGGIRRGLQRRISV